MRTRFGRFLASLAFRSFLLATLIVLAAFFIIKPDVHGHYTERAGGEPHEAAQYSEQDKIFFGLSPEGWTAFWTFGLCGATVALFIATYALFDTAARESDKAEEALKIARISAEASKKSADVARDTLIASHRAWVKIVGAEIIGPMRYGDSGPQIVIQLSFQNIGNSAAIDLGCKMWLMIENDMTRNTLADVQDSQVAQWSKERSLWNFVLYPGDTMQVDPRISICTHAVMPIEEWIRAKAVSQNSANMYVGGIVTYKFRSDLNVYRVTFWHSIDYRGKALTPLEDGLSDAFLSLGDRFWNGRQTRQIVD